jgi:uncharacterized circularly permuted ATP-grasp superfamily protein
MNKAELNLFNNYRSIPGSVDEFIQSNTLKEENITAIVKLFNELKLNQFKSSHKSAQSSFQRNGITFTVYSDKQSTEKIFPFDIIPRIIPATTWQHLERGLIQRITALNCFLNDIYSEQHILKEKHIPRALVLSSQGYQPKVANRHPLGNVYIHIAGIDLIKNQKGEFVVLEDNVRTPSGVSYALENRLVMKRLFPDIFAKSNIEPIDHYPDRLYHALNQLSTNQAGLTIILTPGSHNSAYFEHSFLARKMGVDLARGNDLFVKNAQVYLKTTRGSQLVSVIYRRVDDEYLDPEFFNKDSLLGVPGLMDAYLAGNVVLANAVGNGVADDKAIYHYVPQMIRFYLQEEPILPQVETFCCFEKQHRQYVLENLHNMVVKATDGSGGYDVLIGPNASKIQLETFKAMIIKNPRRYIAQPLIELSTCPTYSKHGIEPRRIDFRPFIITGHSSWVLPGGLTRVAATKESYVVNSSQGGGSKDTWILGDGNDFTCS